jgi:hypothetical protein
MSRAFTLPVLRVVQIIMIALIAQIILLKHTNYKSLHHAFTSFLVCSKTKLKLSYDRRSVGQSASLPWCRATIRARDQFFFLLEIFFRWLRVCYFVAPFLTRGRVCNLVLLQGLASTVPWTQYHFCYPNFLDSSNLEGQVPVFISPRNRVA